MLKKIFSSFKSFFFKTFYVGKETKKAKIIFNPLAGEGKVKKTLKKIRNGFKKYAPNFKFDLFFSRQKEDMIVCAKESVEEDYDVVIVAGGDGAINEVIQGLANSDVALGIIPLGTANVFAREMGIPIDVEKAVQVIGCGKVKRVDLGKVQDKYFLWMSGVGIDALVAKEVHGTGAKDNLGVFAYFFFAVKHLKKIPYFQLKLTVDGKETKHKAVAAFIGNATTYDEFKIKSIDAMDDGYFDVSVVRKVSVFGVARQILFFMIGRKNYYRDINIKYWDGKYYRAKKVRIETNPPVFVHTDGEIIGSTPVEFEIVPKSLSIILP